MQACDTVLLPGVGAFPSAMTHLKALALDKAIIEAAAVGKRIIGVCLGMQLLLTESEEFGSTAGLHLIEGHVRKLPEILKFKVPNIGWCQVLVNETFREDYTVLSTKRISILPIRTIVMSTKTQQWLICSGEAKKSLQ